MIARLKYCDGLSQLLRRFGLFEALPCLNNCYILRSHGVVVGAGVALPITTHPIPKGSAAQARPHGESLKAVRVRKPKTRHSLAQPSPSFLPHSGRKSGSEKNRTALPAIITVDVSLARSQHTDQKKGFSGRIVFVCAQAWNSERVPMPQKGFRGGTDAPTYLSTHTGGLRHGC